MRNSVFLLWAILVPKPIKTKIHIEIILAHKSFSPNPQDAQVIHGGHICVHICVENYIRADIKPRKLQIENQIKSSLKLGLHSQLASRKSELAVSVFIFSTFAARVFCLLSFLGFFVLLVFYRIRILRIRRDLILKLQ